MSNVGVTVPPDKSRTATADRIVAWQYVALAATVLGGAALRFFRLGSWSFWRDELFTLRSLGSFLDILTLETGPSFALTNLIITQLGLSEFNARLASTLFGILALVLLYFPIRRILGVRVALLTTLLLAIAPWHLYWSQNARFYTALLLFFNLGLFCFHIGLEEDRLVYLLLSLVFFALAITERLLGLLFVPVLVAYCAGVLLLRYEKPKGWRIRNFAIFLLPGLLVGLPLAWPYIQDPSRWGTFSFVNNSPVWILGGVVFYVTIPVCIMAAAGAWQLFRERSRTGLLLTMGAGVPLAAIMAASLIQYSANRYVFVALPSMLVLAAVAAIKLYDALPKSLRALGLGAIVLLLAASMADNALYFAFQNGNRPNWKAAFAHVEANMDPDDIVASPERLLGEYYMPDIAKDVASLRLSDLEAGDQRVWFIEDMNMEFQRPIVYEWLNSKAIIDATFDVHVQARNFTMRVHKYEPPGYTAPGP